MSCGKLIQEGMGPVEVKDILAELDNEIARLQQARSLLAGEATRKTLGTPKKAIVVQSAPKKRKLTPEGRKRIAEAMKKRWAEWKKQAS
jgi:ribosomal protein S19E (S16A)